MDQAYNVAQQDATVRPLEGGIGVWKMFADITQRRCAEQGIAQGMQHNVAVGMSQQPMVVCNAHATQGDEVALSETVHIVAVANTHKKTPRFNSGRDSTYFCHTLTEQSTAMMSQMFFDEAGDKEVAVVVARLQAQFQRMTGRLRRLLQGFGLELHGEEVVTVALIHQQ